MQGTIQNYTLEMTGEVKKEPLRVKQYDTNSRWARISLTAFGEPWSIPVGSRGYISIKKVDGTVVLNDCTIEGENQVLVPISEQATAVPGIQQAELYFLSIDGDIKSQTFSIQVLPAIMDQRRIESSDEFGTLQTAILGAQEATQTAQDAAAEAIIQAGEAREAAEIAIDAAASIDTAVQAAAAAKTSETNAKASETAAAQTKADVEALKEGFAGYDKIESGRKYANALTTTVVGEGQVVVTDAWDAPVVRMEISGKSEQVVTTGAQLFEAGKMTARNEAIVKTEDGKKITVSGTKAYSRAEHNIPMGLIANKTLTLSGKIISQTNQSGKALIQVALTLADNTIQYSNVTSAAGKITFIVPIDAKDVNVHLIANNTSTVLDTPNTAVFTDVMINIGDTVLPWEPYTGGMPSPSPEYPQPIISTGTASTGAQMLDIASLDIKNQSGVTFTPQKSGTVITTGIATSTAFLDLWEPTALPLGDYYITGCPSNGSDTKYQIVVYKVNESGYEWIVADDGNGAKISVADDRPIAIRAILRTGTSGPVIFKPMLNPGDTPKPWEPYTGGKPSPSPEYPQPLKVIVNGAQLLDIQDKTYDYLGISIAVRDGVSTLKGTATGNSTMWYAGTYLSTDVLFTLPPGTYTIKDCLIWWSDGINSINKTGTFTITEPFEVTGVSTSGYSTGTVVDETLYPMLNYGNIALPWEPYRAKTVNIPLSEPLRGIDDVRDQICIKDGEWGIERKIKSSILDGSSDEAWRAYAIGDTMDYRACCGAIKDLASLPETDKIIPGLLCNRYTATSNDIMYVQKVIGITLYMSGELRIYDPNYNTSDISLWATYLAENPMTVVYELAEPTWEPLPIDIQSQLNSLSTYSGTTHLTLTAGGPEPDVTVNYVQDTRKVIDGLKLDLAEQITELQAQIDQLKITNNLA